ncbi:MAG: DUF2924 domain-containing protein [Pirellulaceae bacterium]
MQLDIDQEVAVLQQLSTSQLCERYEEVYGRPIRSRHRTYLIRKIAWRLQAQAEGDLTERARKRAEELADDAEVRVMPPKLEPPKPVVLKLNAPPSDDPRLPPAGAALVRKYKGRQIRVVITPDGFEHDGKLYKSLSAVANAVTGSHCSGFRFFNLGGAK